MLSRQHETCPTLDILFLKPLTVTKPIQRRTSPEPPCLPLVRLQLPHDLSVSVVAGDLSDLANHPGPYSCSRSVHVASHAHCATIAQVGSAFRWCGRAMPTIIA